MIRGSGLPLQGVAAWCETSRNTIWRLVHGRTKHPDLRLIRKIRKLADMSGCSPISRDQLEKMHSAAVVEAEQQKAEDRRRAARAAKFRRRQPRDVVPVASEEGDRHKRRTTEWSGIGLVGGYMAAGRIADAAQLLRDVAANGTASDVAGAVVACLKDGHSDLAADLLRYVVQLRSARGQMKIVRILLRRGTSITPTRCQVLPPPSRRGARPR